MSALFVRQTVRWCWAGPKAHTKDWITGQLLTFFKIENSFGVLRNYVITTLQGYNSIKYELCSLKIQATGAELAEMDINFLKAILGKKK